MVTPILPRAQAAITDNGLRGKARLALPPAPEWFDFFRHLLQFVLESGADSGVIASILARLDELEQDGDSFFITGLLSVKVAGTPAGGAVTLQLENDDDAPGNTYYYGTGLTGVKGWFAVASALEATAAGIALTVGADGVTDITPDDDLEAIEDLGGTGLAARTAADTWALRTLAEGAGIDIADGDGVAGNPTISHADTSSVADLTSNNSDGVVIQDVTITFDAFGHVLTATVGTVDLDLRYEPTIAAGTTAQFWRGDKAWSNTLTGSMAIDGATTASPGLLAGIFGLYIAAPDATASFLHLDAFGNSSGLLFRASGGTAASKTAMASAGLIGQFQGRGYNGTAYSGESVSIQFVAAETWTDTAQGSRLLFRTTTNGTTTATTRWRIEDTGDIRPLVDNTYRLGSSTLRPAQTHTQQLFTYGMVAHKGVLTPAQITANQDNYAPTGYSDTYTFRLSSDAARNITGLQGGESGKQVVFMNVGAFSITLMHDVTSTAANRFFCPNNTNIAIRQNGWVMLIYDSTSSRWCVMGA